MGENGGSFVALRVLYDFIAENEEELTVHAGDVVYATEIHNEEWYFCQSADGAAFGLVPVNYCEEIVDEKEKETLQQQQQQGKEDQGESKETLGGHPSQDQTEEEEYDEDVKHDFEKWLGEVDVDDAVLSSDSEVEDQTEQVDVDKAVLSSDSDEEEVNDDTSNKKSEETLARAEKKELALDLDELQARFDSLGGDEKKEQSIRGKQQEEPAAEQGGEDDGIPGADELLSRFENLKQRVADLDELEKKIVTGSPRKSLRKRKSKAESPRNSSSTAPAPSAPPPPPPPSEAKKQLQSSRSEEHRQEEMERLKREKERLALENEKLQREMERKKLEAKLQTEKEAKQRQERLTLESRRRAEELRAIRERGGYLEKAKTSKNMEARLTAFQKQGQACMKQGINLANQAVKADTSKHYEEAYCAYGVALQMFAVALETQIVDRNTRVQLVERMKGYLERMSVLEELLLNVPGSNILAIRDGKRMDPISHMIPNGYDPIPRANELRAKAAKAENDLNFKLAWLLYMEALAFYMGHHQANRITHKPTDQVILKTISSLMDHAQTIKSKM